MVAIPKAIIAQEEVGPVAARTHQETSEVGKLNVSLAAKTERIRSCATSSAGLVCAAILVIVRQLRFRPKVHPGIERRDACN